ncbi:MAG: SRPBCC family protein [Acidobacteriota bacterium]|nr:MAG: SRPBCC family protein [Acidobacteriota bacterium]
MRTLIYFVIAIAVLLAAAFIALGLYIPAEKEFTQVTEINASAESVWKVLKDVEKYPAWQDQLERVEIRNEKEWVEHTPGGAIDFRLVSEDAPRTMEIAYTMGGSFEGKWRGELSPRGQDKTLLRTTDSTKVNGWFTKIMMWFFFDIEDFAKDWNSKLKNRAEAVKD